MPVAPEDFLARPLDAAPVSFEELRADAVEAARQAGADSSVPAEVSRFVAIRSGGHCEIEGCHAFAVAIHHLEHRAGGGGHHPDQLRACCALHHEEAHADPEASWANAVFLEERRTCRGLPG